MSHPFMLKVSDSMGLHVPLSTSSSVVRQTPVKKSMSVYLQQYAFLWQVGPRVEEVCEDGLSQFGQGKPFVQ